MRVRVNQKPLKRIWKTHPAISNLVLERDLSLGWGKLRAKLLVFKSTVSLRRFWKAISKSDLGPKCLGAVNALCCEVRTFQKDGTEEAPFLRVDPKYFCIIGLVKGNLSMEIISHEAVHAAFAFVKRKTRTPWDKQSKDYDEEEIAYPAGRIAAAINRALYKANLYE